MRAPALALLALVAAPALAQEPPATAYRDALDAFLPGGRAPGDMIEAQSDGAARALVADIGGRWLRGLTIMFPGDAPFDPDLAARGCERLGATIAATSPRSFELRVPYPDGDATATYAERYDFVAGLTFLRSFDEAGFLRRLFGDAASDEAALPEGMIARTLAQSGRGEVMVFHPSPDILVLAQPGRPVEILLRCP